MPTGWELARENDFAIDENNNVKIPVKEAVREAVLTVTFETTDGTVVGKETVSAKGKDGEDATFKLGEDFKLPAGYKLSNDREQVTEIKIPFGSVGGHTMVVEKDAEAETKEVHLIYFNVENDENISDAVITVGALDKDVHVENVRQHVPAGWELARENDFAIDENNNVKIPVKRLSAPEEASKDINIIYYDYKTKENYRNVVVSVDKDATEMDAAYVRRNLPEGYAIVDEDGKFPIEADATTRVAVAKASDWEEIGPSTPVEKPEKPEKPNKPGKEENKEDNKKDDKKENNKKAPKTSDEANPLAAAVPAGLSLAAILALLVKKFK